jgi:hypothetical protein
MKSTANNLVLERGILTSAYKEEIKQSISSMKAESLFRVKNKLRKRSSRLYSETGTILKVSMFVLALVVIVF